MLKNLRPTGSRSGSALLSLLLLAGLAIGGYLAYKKYANPTSPPPVIVTTTTSSTSTTTAVTVAPNADAAAMAAQLRTLWNEIQTVRTQYNQAIAAGDRTKAEELRLKHNELAARYEELRVRYQALAQSGVSTGSSTTSTTSAPPARTPFTGDRAQVQKDAQSVLANQTETQIKAKIQAEFGVAVQSIDRDFSRDELITMYGVMKALPAGFVRVKSISRATYHARGGSISGVCTTTTINGQVECNVTIFNASSFDFANTLVHELTHSYANHNNTHPTWEAKFQPSTSPTNYGKTNGSEDLSESVAMYYTNPANLQKLSPERFAWIRQNIMGGREYR